MSFFSRIGSFLASATSSSSDSHHHHSAADVVPFTFQYIEPGRFAYLRIGVDPSGRPVCGATDLHRGLAELVEHTASLVPEGMDPQLACIIVNFLPSSMPAPASAGSAGAAVAASSGAVAAAATALLSPFGTLLPAMDEGDSNVDRLDKLLSFAAAATLYTHNRNDRVVLLAFCDESPHLPAYIDYSALAVAALLMYQHKLGTLDATEALEAVRRQYGLQPSRRHAASHRALLKRMRTLFEIPSFPGGTNGALRLRRVTLAMPKNVGPRVGGLRFVVECRGAVVLQTDADWVQTPETSARELVLDLEQLQQQSKKRMALFGDCILTLYRIDQKAPMLLLRASVNTLFVGRSALESSLRVQNADIDLEPVFPSSSSAVAAAGGGQVMFVPDSISLAFEKAAPPSSSPPTATNGAAGAAAAATASKQQQAEEQHQASIVSDMLKNLELAPLKKHYDSLADMSADKAGAAIAEQTASPSRNRTGSVIHHLNASFTSNNSSFSGSGKLADALEGSGRAKPAQRTESAQASDPFENFGTAGAAAASSSSPVPGSSAKRRPPAAAAAAPQTAAAATPTTMSEMSSATNQLVYAFLRREKENGGLLGAALNEFTALHNSNASSSTSTPVTEHAVSSGSSKQQPSHIRCYTTTLARQAVLTYVSKTIDSSAAPPSFASAKQQEQQRIMRSGVSASVVHASSSSTSSAAASSSSGPAAGPLIAAQFKVVPRAQWREKGNTCAFQDCGVAFGLFSFGSDYCRGCGLFCCSSCISTKAPLPNTEEYPEPVPTCPRCLDRLNKFMRVAAAQQRHQQQQQQKAAGGGAAAVPSSSSSSSASLAAAAAVTPNTRTPAAATTGGGAGVPAASSPVPAWAKQQQQQQQSQAAAAAASVAAAAAAALVIRVAKKERWQDPAKVPKCQEQNGCATTFGGFWGSKAQNCYMCGCCFCKEHIVAETELPPTYMQRVPVCGRCFSSAEMQKKEAVHKAARKRETEQQQQQQQQQRESAVAAATMQQVPDLCFSREASPEFGAASAATAEVPAAQQLLTATPNKALQRTQSGGNWLQYGRQQKQQQHQQNPSATASGVATPSRDAGGDAGAARSTSPVPPTVQLVRANTVPLHSLIARPNATGANESLPAEKVVPQQQQQQQQPSATVVAEVPPPSPLAETAKPGASPPSQQNSAPAETVVTVAPVAHVVVEPAPAPVAPKPAAAPANPLFAEMQARAAAALAKQQGGGATATAASTDAVKPEPVKPPIAAGGGHSSMLAELAARRGADPPAASTTTAATTTTSAVEQPPKPAEPAPAAAAQKTSDADDGTKKIYGKTNGSFRPPLSGFPKVKLQELRKLVPVPGTKPGDAEEEPAETPAVVGSGGGAIYGKTSGAFRPPLTNFPRIALRELRKKVPIPGPQQPEETEEAGTKRGDGPIYGKTNGSFRPPLTNFPPLKRGLIPIPGKPAGAAGEEAAAAALAPSAVPAKPMNAAQAMMAALLAKKMPGGAPTKTAASPTAPAAAAKAKLPQLKTIFWKKLAGARLARSALWNADLAALDPAAAAAMKPPKPDQDLIRSLFEKKSAADLAKGAAAAAAAGAGAAGGDKGQPKGKKSAAVTAQRQQNVGIALKKLKLGPAALCDKILACELDDDDVEALRKCLPQDDEIRNVKHEKSEWDKTEGGAGFAWGDVEHFFYEVCTKIPDCRERLQLWQAALEIPRSLETAERQLRALERVTACITSFDSGTSQPSTKQEAPESSVEPATAATPESDTSPPSSPGSPSKKQQSSAVSAPAPPPPARISQHLVCVLRSILQIVNVVNAGTAAGNAAGFTLESLQTLVGSKATDNKTTLLEVVFQHLGARAVEEMGASFDTLADALPAAVASPLPATSTLISTISNSVQRLRKIATTAAAAAASSGAEDGGNSKKSADRLVGLMSEAYDRYSSPAADLVYRLQQIKDSVAAALEFLGEDKGGDDAVVYAALLAFCRDFSKARTLWLRKQEAQEKARKKQAEQDQKDKQLAASSAAATAALASSVAPAADLENATPTSATPTAAAAPEQEQSPNLTQIQRQRRDQGAPQAQAAAGAELADARLALKKTVVREESSASPTGRTGAVPAEPGWESSPSALFTRVPARRIVAEDDDWDEK